MKEPRLYNDCWFSAERKKQRCYSATLNLQGRFLPAL